MSPSTTPTSPPPTHRPPSTSVDPAAPSGGSGASYRSQLSHGDDTVDPATWAGSVPQAQGIAPRVRVGRSRWFNLLWLLPIGFVLLIVAVAAAKGLRERSARSNGSSRRYPGTVATAPAQAPRACRSGSGCSTSSTCSC